MKHALMVGLILLSGCLMGCANVGQAMKTAAAEAATKATKTAMIEGKKALKELGKEADAGLRALGSDLYEVAKVELATSGTVAAFKLSEVVGKKFTAAVPKPVADKTVEMVMAYLTKQGVIMAGPDGTMQANKDKPMTLFQELIAGFGGIATAAVGVGATSVMNKNKHDRTITRKKYEQELRDKPPAPTVAA